MNDAFLRQDFAASNAPFADDVEWDTTRIGGTVPDLAGVYHGTDGQRELWTAWMAPWSKILYEYELVDAGDTVVSLIRNQRQWGRHSDAVTQIPDYAWVYTFREREVIRGCWYPNHQSALEDHGEAE
jgi:hypothetical protein